MSERRLSHTISPPSSRAFDGLAHTGAQCPQRQLRYETARLGLRGRGAVAHEVLICVRIKLQAPRAIDARDCACSMAWRFHAVDATLAFSG